MRANQKQVVRTEQPVSERLTCWLVNDGKATLDEFKNSLGEIGSLAVTLMPKAATAPRSAPTHKQER